MRPFYKSVLCLLPLWSILFSVNAAVISASTGSTASPSVNESSFLGSSPNINFLVPIDPAKFRSSINYGELKLPATSVLINAVDVMVQLALQDWDSQMGPKTFKLDIPRYSQIEIIISPWDTARGATLHSGFAVLGLFEVILNILGDPTRRFKSVQSTFLYEGVQVGWLMIRRTAGTASVSAFNNTNAIVPTFPTFAEAARTLDDVAAPTAVVGGADLTAPAWDDSQLKVEYIQGQHTFTIYEIFFAVIASIKEMAVHDRTARVDDFSTYIDTPPITTAGQPIVISFRSHDNPPRTAEQPPYFKWEWLIKAFGQVPQYMLASTNFRDILHMALIVDRVPVGDGYVVRRQAGLDVVGGVSDNVTTA